VILALDEWLLPAVAASSASYLVALAWERIRPRTAPSGLVAAFLAGLSFVMGAFSAWYRVRWLDVTPENNVIVMFLAGAATTYAWLLLRKFMPFPVNRRDTD
jgi:riboflavin transporter FmnP